MMNILKIGAAVLATATAFALPVGASAQSRGKVLVVMSSAHALDLRDGKKYSTGYYLNEFVVPYRKLVEAGYEPVIANPNGDMPMMDANSNDKLFFGGDDAARADALKYAQGIAQPKHPKTLASVVAEGPAVMSACLSRVAMRRWSTCSGPESWQDHGQLPRRRAPHRDHLSRADRVAVHGARPECLRCIDGRQRR